MVKLIEHEDGDILLPDEPNETIIIKASKNARDVVVKPATQTFSEVKLKHNLGYIGKSLGMLNKYNAGHWGTNMSSTTDMINEIIGEIENAQHSQNKEAGDINLDYMLLENGIKECTTEESFFQFLKANRLHFIEMKTQSLVAWQEFLGEIKAKHITLTPTDKMPEHIMKEILR